MKVGIIMGSKSDWPTMKLAAEMLEQFGVPYETKVLVYRFSLALFLA